jgi:asparagine synthase (glutamine-hydrolysing)
VFNDQSDIVNLLKKVCNSIPHEAILLSGGLDSSILLHLTQPKDAITITLNQYSNDLKFSALAVKGSKSNHHIINPDLNEITSNIRELVFMSKTFDPMFIRNNVIQLIGCKRAIELGRQTIIIGDGADELFAGYNYLHKYVNEPHILDKKINDLFNNMDFFSNRISNFYKIKVFLPFLEPQIIKFSKTLTTNDKISRYEGRLYGKFFLRERFLPLLGKEIVWRKKEALETGSGMTLYVSRLEELIEDEHYIVGVEEAANEGVIICNKEHLLYYNIYRQFFDPPYKDQTKSITSKICTHCNATWEWRGDYCKICGTYPGKDRK